MHADNRAHEKLENEPEALRRRPVGLEKLEADSESSAGELEAMRLWRTAFESVGDAFCLLDREGKVLDCNAAMTKFFKRPHKDLIGRPCHELVRHGERPLEDCAFRRMLRSRQRETTSFSWHDRWLRCLIDPILNESGEISGAVHILEDISELKRAEEEARISEERFRILFEYAPDGYYLNNLEGNFVDGNRAAESITGYGREELIGKNFLELDLLSPDQLSRAGECLAKNVEGLPSGPDEFLLKRKDGTRIPVEIRTYPVQRKGETLVLGIARDITERKKAEEELEKYRDHLQDLVESRTAELKRSEEKYRLHFENASDVIFSLGPDFRLLTMSPSVERILGYAPHEMIGKAVQDLNILVPESLEQALSDIRRVLAGEEIRFTVHEFVARDGTRKFGEVSAVPLFREGRAVAVISVARDITERRKAEETLRRTEAMLQQSQKMEAIGRLAGGIAHDFNNLLTVISGYSQLVSEILAPDSPISRDMQEIMRAADRATVLTRQLLAFSRMQVLKPEVLNLNKVVTDLERMLRRVIGEGVILIAELNPTIGNVEVDPGQIEQVIMNLAVNARDAMPEGGQLIIETDNVELDEAFVSRYPEVRPGSYIMFSMSDSGYGMDEDTRAKIFEPFFTTKDRGKGTGLGLATVYGIVKQSGGHITCDSNPGIGTVFRIYLPRIEAPARESGKDHEDEETRRGSETILLVEDEEMVREIGRRALSMFGYKVLEASTGEEALRLAKQHADPIQLLLTDIAMPGMSGLDLFHRMAPLHPELKVLFMSGYAPEAIDHHGILKPGTVFIEKPFAPLTLLQLVKKVLRTPE
jgi:PAS domain S-box-containing protein